MLHRHSNVPWHRIGGILYVPSAVLGELCAPEKTARDIEVSMWLESTVTFAFSMTSQHECKLKRLGCQGTGFVVVRIQSILAQQGKVHDKEVLFIVRDHVIR